MPPTLVVEKQRSLGGTKGLCPESLYPFSLYTPSDPGSEGSSYSMPH